MTFDLPQIGFAEKDGVHRRLVGINELPSCLSCVNFQKGEQCLLAKARPPAENIVFGCPLWEADIPF